MSSSILSVLERELSAKAAQTAIQNYPFELSVHNLRNRTQKFRFSLAQENGLERVSRALLTRFFETESARYCFQIQGGVSKLG